MDQLHDDQVRLIMSAVVGGEIPGAMLLFTSRRYYRLALECGSRTLVPLVAGSSGLTLYSYGIYSASFAGYLANCMEPHSVSAGTVFAVYYPLPQIPHRLKYTVTLTCTSTGTPLIMFARRGIRVYLTCSYCCDKCSGSRVPVPYFHSRYQWVDDIAEIKEVFAGLLEYLNVDYSMVCYKCGLL